MAPTEVAGTIPITNTGKIRLELKRIGPPATFWIPIKGSIVMTPGRYEVIAYPIGPPVIIAHIDYAINGFKVTPTAQSVRDARFAVYVNLSEP